MARPRAASKLYQVTWDAANATHHHHVVNALAPQRGATSANGPGGRAYFQAHVARRGPGQCAHRL